MARFEDISLAFDDIIDTPLSRRRKVEQASADAEVRMLRAGGPFAGLAAGIAGSLPGITENIRTTGRDAGLSAFETSGERLAQNLSGLDLTTQKGRDDAVKLVSQANPAAGVGLENLYAERELARQQVMNRYQVDSERYANGTTWTRNARGGIQVSLADGTVITDPEGIQAAIESGRQSDIDDERAQASARAEGELAVKQLEEVAKNVSIAMQGADRNQQFIELIDQGADATIYQTFVPAWFKDNQTIEFNNLAALAGFDIISAVTFGALSKAELEIAMDTAVPRFTSNEAARAHFVKRRDAQRALAEEFSAYQNFIQANRGKFANKYEFKKAYDDSRKDVREARLKAINEGGDGNLRTLSDNDLEEARQIQAQYGTGDPNE